MEANGWILIVIIIVVLLAAAIAADSKQEKDKQNFELIVEKAENFDATTKRLAGSHWVGIDEIRGKVIVNRVGSATFETVDSDQILSVVIFEDGQTVLKSGRGKATAKAAFNTVFIPGLNLLTGGPKAKAHSVEKVKRIELRVVTDAPNSLPVIRILDIGVPRASVGYKEADETARFLHAKLTRLLETADGIRRNSSRSVRAPDQGTGQAESTLPSLGLAQELNELANLRDKGILTSNEFEEQKSRLLRN